ncbi:MAG: hypothetical protein JWM57_4163 [Phycisphaerales bacterium]|nr:hypothetical protein [Phycisphaerales bacterium]
MLTAGLLTAGLLSGCATNGKKSAGAQLGKPPELQTLADLQPPAKLPLAPAAPTDEASTEALEHYAQGRDALLKNQKATAIEHLATANKLDPYSAVLARDLGYAELGMDDAKAQTAFLQACRIDPNDADSRLQLARLLLAKNQTADATDELRRIRLTADYADGGGLAAVVDLLLGQCLEQNHFNTAALECYENVIAIADERAYDLRGRPELADLLGRPGILILRAADLATQCGQYARASALYQRLQKQEPQSALMLELRLARTELAAGDRTSATKRAFAYVVASNSATLSVALFDELYQPYGGASAALAELEKLKTVELAPYQLLVSHLQLQSGDAKAAIETVNGVGRSAVGKGDAGAAINLPLVRQTVAAYRAADDSDGLIRELLRRTAADPTKWHTWERGWEMLTHFGQPKPLSAETLIKLSVDPKLAAVRNFVAGQLRVSQGRQASGAELTWAARNEGDPHFDTEAAYQSPTLNLSDLDDVTTSRELAVLIDAYRDDPELLTATVAEALRSGQKRMALDAFETVAAARPTDPVIASAYAQVLAADEQRSAASTALEKAAAAAQTAPQIYFIASQYSGIGDDKSSERLLRKAHDLDANFAPVCNDLGYLLADQGRDLSMAEELLQRAVALEPDNAAYLDSLGWLLYKRGKFAEAAERLEKAVKVSTPVDPVVLDHAGDALYQHKQPNESAQRWQQAVDAIKERGTNDPQLRLRVEQKLQKLKDKAPVPVAPVAKAG